MAQERLGELPRVIKSYTLDVKTVAIIERIAQQQGISKSLVVDLFAKAYRDGEKDGK